MGELGQTGSEHWHRPKIQETGALAADRPPVDWGLLRIRSWWNIWVENLQTSAPVKRFHTHCRLTAIVNHCTIVTQALPLFHWVRPILPWCAILRWLEMVFQRQIRADLNRRWMELARLINTVNVVLFLVIVRLTMTAHAGFDINRSSA